MTNLEYFRNWFKVNEPDVFIKPVAVLKKSGRPTFCDDISCKECLFEKPGSYCRTARREWLKKEHVDRLSIDLSKLKVDDKIRVSDDGENWQEAHFAGIDPETGKPKAWANGRTSWSSNVKYIWQYVKLPEDY